MGFIDYLVKGPDPVNVAVFLEDAATVSGIALTVTVTVTVILTVTVTLTITITLTLIGGRCRRKRSRSRRSMCHDELPNWYSSNLNPYLNLSLCHDELPNCHHIKPFMNLIYVRNVREFCVQ